MASAEVPDKKSDKKKSDWKMDQFVVCLQDMKFLDEKLLKSLYDEREALITFAEEGNLDRITAICTEELEFKVSQGGLIGRALIKKYRREQNPRVEKVRSKAFTQFGPHGVDLEKAGKIVFVASKDQEIQQQRESLKQFAKVSSSAKKRKRKAKEISNTNASQSALEKALDNEEKVLFGYEWKDSSEASIENRVGRSKKMNEVLGKFSSHARYIDESYFNATCDISKDNAAMMIDATVVDARDWCGRYDGFVIVNELKDEIENDNDIPFYVGQCHKGHSLKLTEIEKGHSGSYCCIKGDHYIGKEEKEVFTCEEECDTLCQIHYNEKALSSELYKAYQTTYGSVTCDCGGTFSNSKSKSASCVACETQYGINFRCEKCDNFMCNSCYTNSLKFSYSLKTNFQDSEQVEEANMLENQESGKGVKDENDNDNEMDNDLTEEKQNENVPNDGGFIGLELFRKYGRCIVEFKKDNLSVADEMITSISGKTRTAAAEYQLVIELFSALLIAPKDRPIMGILTNLEHNNQEARIAYVIKDDIIQVTRTTNTEAYKALKHCVQGNIADYYPDIVTHSKQGQGTICKLNHPRLSRADTQTK